MGFMFILKLVFFFPFLWFCFFDIFSVIFTDLSGCYWLSYSSYCFFCYVGF